MSELLKGAGAFVCGDKTPFGLEGQNPEKAPGTSSYSEVPAQPGDTSLGAWNI